MNDSIKKHMDIETPRESAEAMERLSDSLAKMDTDQGIYGEAMLDEEMDSAAGGNPGITVPDRRYWAWCRYCNTHFRYSKLVYPKSPPKFCSNQCSKDFSTRGGYLTTGKTTSVNIQDFLSSLNPTVPKH